MIVKIMKPGKGFFGVSYNEKKNEIGQSELLTAKNFDGLEFFSEIRKEDLIHFMEKFCQKNSRVENKQFHAVISCKGRENSPSELCLVAEEFLAKMGYGENPYLIYSHSDTNNNHVHIVSTRVDSRGKKVDSAYEKIRSQQVLNNILNVDVKKDVNKAYSECLGYTYSTDSQFKMLMEKKGININIKDNQIELIKNGIVIDIKKYELNMRSKKEQNVRARQICAILHKYKLTRNIDELSKFINNKFGVELIFHKGKDHVIPYGYTIIDHVGRCVYKGSEILDLKTLMNNDSPQMKCEEIIKSLDCSGFIELKENLKKYGYTITNKGSVNFKGQLVQQIHKDKLNDLLYQDRLNEALLYKIDNDSTKEILAKFYSINISDLKNEKIDQGWLSVLQTKSISDFQTIKYNGNNFLLDKDSRIIVNINSMQQGKKLHENYASLFVDILGAIEWGYENDQPRRKKRNIKI